MGKRNKSPGRLGKAARNVSRQRGLPRDVRNLIKGRIVDLSSAHRYYKMVWDAVRPRLEAVVAERGKERYKLATRFFQFFMESLGNLIEFPQIDRIDGTGADLIVSALYEAGMHYGTTPNPPPHGPITLWPADRPISEAWSMCGELRALMGHNAVIEDPGPGHELREPLSRDYEFPRILLRVRVSGDRSVLPKVTIELEGELAGVLEKGMYYSPDPYDQRVRRNEAKRIWDAIFKELRVLVGIGRSYEGRPADLRPDFAAYLKYFHDLPWPKVAEQHCPKKHTHTKKCKENVRKAVANYFDRLKQDARRLPPASGQE
jgi:hypothetical protein